MPNSGSMCVAAVMASIFAGVASGAQTPLLSQATDLGRVRSSSPVDITVWLKLHDTDGLNNMLTAQREGKAPWLSDEQFQQHNAPLAADVAAVNKFLASQGLTPNGVGPNNLYVKASGSAARVESALRVQLHRYNLRGTTFRASTSSPTLPTDIAPLVSSIGGLSTLGARPMIAHAMATHAASTHAVHPSDAEHLPSKPMPLSASSDGLVFSAQCFFPETTVSFSGGGVDATYHGLVYGASITNTAAGSVAPCGYQPSDLQTAYNLTPLYKVGLDGTGETIAIVDAYGSTTVRADLATFSAVMGLPAPNLTIIGTPTESGFSGDVNSGWADETTLDVEWVHAIAPGAKILLVIAPTDLDDDLFAGIVTASMQPGVVSISNSWADYESATDIPTRQSADQIFKIAGARGQSVNFASGDSGNEAVNLGYADVDYPASSPYATAIGGVSVALNANKHVVFQSSWGNNITELADKASLGAPPLDPPFTEGFVFGGGGGTSNVYPQPNFQHALGGQRRLVPDISWVADPYTGVEIIETEDAAGDQSIGAIGGTSLATPMFSALWGIATQKAGHRLGQAAPYLYSLPAGAITDVVASQGYDNVSGELTDSDGPQRLTPWDLALPLQGQQNFVSALYNSPYSTRWFALTFGTDSTLQAGPGWDPATGLGTPNGWYFVQSFH